MNYNFVKNYLDGEDVEVKKIRDGLGQGMAELGEQERYITITQ